MEKSPEPPEANAKGKVHQVEMTEVVDEIEDEDLEDEELDEVDESKNEQKKQPVADLSSSKAASFSESDGSGRSDEDKIPLSIALESIEGAGKAEQVAKLDPGEVRQVASEIVAKVVKDAGRILEERRKKSLEEEDKSQAGTRRRSARNKESKENGVETKKTEKDNKVEKETNKRQTRRKSNPKSDADQQREEESRTSTRSRRERAPVEEEEAVEKDINDIADFIREEAVEKVPAEGDGQEEKQIEEVEQQPSKVGNKKKRRSSSSSTAKKGRKPSLVDPPKEGDDQLHPPPQTSISSGRRALKPVQNWRKAIRLPPSGVPDRSEADQVFPPSVLPAYIPCVPPGTSQRLIEYLTEADVELLCCPGCKDRWGNREREETAIAFSAAFAYRPFCRFVMPTTFFQHVYRKSAEITFSCQSCSEVLTFNNR